MMQLLSKAAAARKTGPGLSERGMWLIGFMLFAVLTWVGIIYGAHKLGVFAAIKSLFS